MITTIEEAKAKWCPHARVMQLVEDSDSAPLPVHNRVSMLKQSEIFGGNSSMETKLPATSSCAGAVCMAWRWYDGPKGQLTGDAGTAPTYLPRRGFCGLSGLPNE